MAGSTINERNVVLSYLFKEKVIKNVIFSLDWWLFNSQNDTSKFDFLYTENLFDLFKIYFNDKSIICALKWSKTKECVGKKIDIFAESSVSWYEWSKEYFGGLQHFIKNEFGQKDLKRLLNPHTDSSNTNKSPQELIAPLIEIFKNNAKTRFHIILPTYHRLFYITQGKEFFAIWQEHILYFLGECEKLANVRIYGLDDLAFADDIANYKDLQHYSPQMNIMQLEAIANSTHILTTKNIQSYFAIMQNGIESLDITPFMQAARTLMDDL